MKNLDRREHKKICRIKKSAGVNSAYNEDNCNVKGTQVRLADFFSVGFYIQDQG